MYDIYIYFISGVGIFLEIRVSTLESIKLLYFTLQLSISECIRERNLSYQKYFMLPIINAYMLYL